MINGDFPLWQIVWGFHGDYVRFRVRERSAAGQADGVSRADLWWLSPWPCLFRIKFLKCKLYHINSSGSWHTGLSVCLPLSLLSSSQFLSISIYALGGHFLSKATQSRPYTFLFLNLWPWHMTLALRTPCSTCWVIGTLSVCCSSRFACC